jgi:hypothetical protein
MAWARLRRKIPPPSNSTDCGATLEATMQPKRIAVFGVWRLLPPHRFASCARLRPAPIPAPKRVAQLLADLDDDDFRVRTAAQKEREMRGESVAAALRSAAAKPNSLEADRRIKDLRDRIQKERKTPSAERIRVLRGVEVLEKIGTSEARRILTDLAGGAAEGQLTEEAKASLQRLAKSDKSSR